MAALVELRNDIKTHRRLLRRGQKGMVRRLGELAVKHFNENFEKQGFVDGGVDSWLPRKNNTDPGRPILIKTGRLKKATRISTSSKSQVRIVNKTPYAGKHNVGTAKIPQRQFSGSSLELDVKSVDLIEAWVKTIMVVT